MLYELRYGRKTGSLRLADDQQCGHFAGPHRDESVSVGQIVRQALAEPIEAPPIHRACTPDDRVAIVLDPQIPSAAELLVPLFEDLAKKGGIDPTRISVVHSARGAQGNIEQAIEDLPDEWADVRFVPHHPEDESGVSYLASTASGQRVYLNREVIDADFYFVVSRIGFDAVTGWRGPASQLFPTLSNQETLTRGVRIATEHRHDGSGLWQRQTCEEVAQLAGLFFGVGVVLGGDGEIDQVWAGHFAAVEKAGEAYLERAWSPAETERQADLVVAVLSASSNASHWEDLGSALESSQRLLGDHGGAIAVVSDLSDDPGQAGRELIGQGVSWESIQEVRQGGAPDAPCMVQCAETALEYKVYLLSGAGDDVVDALAMVPVASLHEIENLARRYQRVFLLENADLVRVPPRVVRVPRSTRSRERRA